MKLKSRRDLRRAQKKYSELIKDIPGVILCLPMGGGKTVTTLTAFDDLIEEGFVRKVLIVAPLRVAQGTWPDEFTEWEHLRHMTRTLIRAEDTDADVMEARKSFASMASYIGLTGAQRQRFIGKRVTSYKQAKRVRLAHEDTEVHIINKEALVWLWELFGKGKHWPYDALVVDESSMFKNGKLRTAKKQESRLSVARKIGLKSKRTVLLTGTPAPKGLINLWGQGLVVDNGKRLGKSRVQYEKTYFIEDYTGFKIIPRDDAQDKIMGKLQDVMFGMHEADCVDVPPLVPVPRKVKLPSHILERYQEFEENLVSSAYDVRAVNRGVLHNKLLQFANGGLYKEDGSVVEVHDEKLGMLEDITYEVGDTPLLIAYMFEFDLKRILKMLPKATVWGRGDIKRTKAAWNAGDIPWLLAQPQSIGHGQNIQFGSNQCVWFGLTPDLEIFQQFNKRLARSGQKASHVFAHYILAEGTKDMDLLPILSDREAKQDDIINTIRFL